MRLLVIHSKVVISVLVFILTLSCTKETNYHEEDFSGKYPLSSDTTVVVNIEDISTHDIEFRRDATFTDSEEAHFRFLGNVSVDENNRVFIAEKNHIKVFESNGRFIKNLGQKGRGPGEFNNFGGLQPKIGASKLYAFDDSEQRINVFNLDSLEYVYAIHIQPKNWDQLPNLEQAAFKDYHIVSDSLILAGFTDIISPHSSGSNIRRYYLMNRNGEIISDEILTHPDNDFFNGHGVPPPISPYRPLTLPSNRNAISDVSEDGNIFWGWTDKIRIYLFDAEGKELKTFNLLYENKELEKDDVLSVFTYNPNVHQRAKSADFPDTWPAMDYFFVDDDNRIWISTITESDDYFKWIVLNDSGELLATFNWQGSRKERHFRRREIKQVRNNYLYTLEMNEETKQREVVRYKIELNKRER